MYFPIGDMHGAYEIHRKLYDKIVDEIGQGIDPAFGGTIVFMGDYIDRGPNSKEIVDWLMGIEDFEVNGHPVKHIFLRGNHEQFPLDYLLDPHDDKHLRVLEVWLRNGGKATLDSFECTTQEMIDGKIDKYLDWFRQLPIIAHDPDYVFVHAGIDRYARLEKQDEFHCLWGMDRNKQAYKGYNRVVVHGHMMNKAGPIVDIANNRIWMDVGANLFGRAATVCLPEPFDYGYESDGGNYKIIEVKPFKLTRNKKA